VSQLGQVIDLKKEFGLLRVLDGPIDEEWQVGGAIGMAMTGTPAIAYVPGMCTLRAFELVFNQAGKWRYMTGGQTNLPLVIWQVGMGRNPGLAAQHADAGQEVLYASIPGLRVVVPSNPYDAKGLMTAALRNGDPVAFFHYGAINAASVDVPDNDYVVPIGEAAVRQEGHDITIVGIAAAQVEVMKAAKGLQAAGISAEIIDPRTLKPFPIEAVAKSVSKTRRLLVCDHGHETAGSAAEIIALTAMACPGAKFARCTFPDAPSPAAKEMILWMTPHAENVIGFAKKMLS